MRIHALNYIVLLLFPAGAVAADNLSFSVPIQLEPEWTYFNPQLRTSYSRTIPNSHTIGVSEGAISVEGLAWPIKSNWGLDFAAEANHEVFSTDSPILPHSLTEENVTIGAWYKFSDALSLEAAFTRSDIYGSGKYIGRGFLNTYSIGCEYHISDYVHAFAVVGVMPDDQSSGHYYVSPSLGVTFAEGEHWKWKVGYPNSTVAYSFTKRLYGYFGADFSGDLFSGNDATAYPNIEDVHIYREADLRAGVVWTPTKWWSIDVSIGVPIWQRFGYRP